MSTSTDKSILWQVTYKAAVDLVAAGIAVPQTSDIAAELAALADQFYAHASVAKEAATGGTLSAGYDVGTPTAVPVPATVPVPAVAVPAVASAALPVPYDGGGVGNAPAPTNLPPSSPPVASPAPGNEDLASEAQRGFVVKLLGWNNKTLADYGVTDIATIGWRDAKKIIEELKK